MTESEIMKALECCKMPVGSGACNLCPLKETWEKRLSKEEKSCTTILLEDALDLINRKNAEIERLSKEVDRLSQVVLYHDGQISDARAEAIKEVLDRVKPIIGEMVDIMWDSDMSKCLKGGCHYPSNIPCGSEMCIEENKVIWNGKIDQIAKEMGVEL